MPEEKKENKAAKDSFTFSDKIKNSKAAGSKSFANRISSKIGSDGKPKKTLFERTKRDAPFFIAAIVALLLLPFLYKYSGSVGEEPSMVTPGLEDTAFDPTRSGFDTLTGDPENQIAQLSGIDSLSLIKGFGSNNEEASDELPDRDDFDRSGLDDDFSSSNTTVERNETNITRHRRQAAPATRAAFKKTNINPLRGAGLTSRGGGKLGVGMWGGGLKKAADKVKADRPKSSPKPVSLQPLQAAGKPSRSYFGQGAAAEARRSKDAMSKANAVQALRDAQMKAIEPGKIGGIVGGDFGGPGGGNGNLDRKFAFNGKEPWWWDMMKKRSQMEWEKKFNYKWGWIDFATGLAQKLADGLLSCLITGTDDWSMGKMFGAAAGVGGGAECCGMNEEKFKGAAPGVEFSPNSCKGWVIAHPEVGCTTKWVEAKKNKTSLGPISQRLDCLSNGIFAARKARKASEGLAEAGDCATFYKDGRYVASVSGKYTPFHYVVGVRSADWNKYVNGSDEERYNLLYVGYVGRGNTFSVNPATTGQLVNQKSFIPLFIESVAVKNKKVKKKGVGTKADTKAVDEDDEEDVEGRMAVLITKDCKRVHNAKTGVDELKCTNKAANLKYADLLAKLRKGGLQFGNQDESGSSSVLMSVKGSKYGKNWETGARCAYPMAFVSCHDTATAAVNFGNLNTAGNPAAFLTFPNVGKAAAKAASAQDVQKMFRVTYRVENRLKADSSPLGYFVQTIDNTQDYVPNEVVAKKGGREIGAKYNIAASGKGAQAVLDAMGDESDATKSAAVTWEIRQCWNAATPWSFGRTIADGACGRSWNAEAGGVNGKELPGIVVSSATCMYGDEGDLGGDPRRQECESIHQSPECCSKLTEGKYNYINGQCVPPECTDPNQSAYCCHEMKGPDYEYRDGQCVGKKYPIPPTPPQDPNAEPKTLYLAPKISEIPSYFEERPVAFTKATKTGTADTFGSCKVSSNIPVHNGAAALAYVTNVLQKVNQQAAFKNQNTTIEHKNIVTIGNLVDAMTLAFQLDTNATVPTEVVCAMGKAIGFSSQDPHVKQANNMLGAFAAYIDENSSFYPAKKDMNNEDDRRFIGCSGGKETGVKAGYHYGSYNWNEKTLGDLDGGEGRNPYVNVLAGNPYWGKKGDFPLAAIGQAIDYQITRSITDAQRKDRQYNGTLDDYNRKAFHNTYANLYRDSNPNVGCGGLKGNMSVSSALEYIGRVCSNGLNAKPQNGRTTCGRNYKESQQKGAK